MVAPSSRIDEYRGTMRSGQERIDLVSFPIERQRVGARFGRRHFVAAHRADIDDVDDAGFPDGDVKVSGLRMQENDVRGPAEGDIGEHVTRRGVDCKEDAGIAGAEQPARGRLELQSVRSRRRNLVLFRDPGRITRIDGDDPRRGCDIDEEHLARRVVDGPTRTIRNLDFGDPPTEILKASRSACGANTETVFSPRLDVKTSPRASDTSAPATAVSPGIDSMYLSRAVSITSTASLPVWAT